MDVLNLLGESAMQFQQLAVHGLVMEVIKMKCVRYRVDKVFSQCKVTKIRKYYFKMRLKDQSFVSLKMMIKRKKKKNHKAGLWEEVKLYENVLYIYLSFHFILVRVIIKRV